MTSFFSGFDAAKLRKPQIFKSLEDLLARNRKCNHLDVLQETAGNYTQVPEVFGPTK